MYTRSKGVGKGEKPREFPLGYLDPKRVGQEYVYGEMISYTGYTVR